MISLYNVSALIGLGAILTITLKLSHVVRLHYHSSRLWRYNHPSGDVFQSTKAWALVTGASDGIGLGFAHELCARNFNVILHGRNHAKLQKVKASLLSTFDNKIDIHLLVFDASFQQKTAPDTFDATILSHLRDLNLTVLVNNVGGSGGPATPAIHPLAATSFADLDALINVNARFMAQLTRVLLPQLIRSRPALILNVSSALEEIPMPYAAAYSASKAFMSMWSRCLKAEMVAEGHGDGVEVMSLVVGKVITAGAGREGETPSLDAPSAAAMARCCLDKVGFGSVVVSPWTVHALQLGVVTSLPEWVIEKIMIGLVGRR